MIIYLTTNNINGKRYIGLDTANNPNYLGSGKHFKLSLKKYGKENFTKEILGEYTTIEELKEAEVYFIDKYNAVEDENFYNLAIGGGKVIIQGISQYDKEGSLIKKWTSIRQCEKETGYCNSKLTSVARGHYGRRTAYGYVWRYDGDAFDKYPTTPQVNITAEQRKSLSERQKGSGNVMSDKTGKDHPNHSEVSQLSLDGKLIKEWDSITEAMKELKINNISACCRGLRKKAGGFIWKYSNDIVRSPEKSGITESKK